MAGAGVSVVGGDSTVAAGASGGEVSGAVAGTTGVGGGSTVAAGASGGEITLGSRGGGVIAAGTDATSEGDCVAVRLRGCGATTLPPSPLARESSARSLAISSCAAAMSPEAEQLTLATSKFASGVTAAAGG